MRKRGRGGRYGGAGARRGPPNVSGEAMDNFLAGAMSGFSMRDEARNTTRDHLKWDRDEKLRYRPIAFISAGFIEPLKEFQFEAPKSKTMPALTLIDDSDPQALDLPRTATVFGQASEPERPRTTTAPVSSDSRDAEQTAPTVPLFTDTIGDEAIRRKGSPAVQIPDRDLSGGESASSDEEVILFKGRSAISKRPAHHIIAKHIRLDHATAERNPEAQLSRNPRQPSSRSRAPSPSKSPGAPSSPKNRTKPTIIGRVSDRSGGHTCDIEGTAESFSDDPLSDYVKNMDGIDFLLDHRRRFATRELGGTDDEAGEVASDGSEAVSDGDKLEVDAALTIATVADEECWPSDIDDALLARLLAKQESLGLGSDKLLLFDETAASRGSRRKSPRAPARPVGPKPTSASGAAQGFDDLDLVMDWGRVNPPRRRSKAHIGEVKFAISDNELRATVEAAYKKDRLRKTERKKEREELRDNGMLGKKANPNDPRVKYPDGINIIELEEEVCTFLEGSDQVLSLPPMDSAARKIVHEVANRLKIKSKSSGSGDQRRPVLHRTKSTRRYTEAEVHQVFMRIHRKSFPRLDRPRKSAAGGSGGARSGGSGALRYRDGEVVGGSAPELGETNKGRAMLEKMGWTKGTGLGAVDNKGILEPVAHVIKMSKAGLG